MIQTTQSLQIITSDPGDEQPGCYLTINTYED